MTKDDLKVTVVWSAERPTPPRWPEVVVWARHHSLSTLYTGMTDTRRPKTPFFYLYDAYPRTSAPPDWFMAERMSEAMWRSYRRAHPAGCSSFGGET